MKVYDLFKGKPIFREFRDYLTCYKTMNRYGNYDYWNRIDAKQRTVYVAQKIVDLYLQTVEIKASSKNVNQREMMLFKFLIEFIPNSSHKSSHRLQ